QGQDIGPEAAGELFGQGVVTGGEPSSVQGPAERGNPLVVEMMEDAGVDAGPVVNRHGFPLRGCGEELPAIIPRNPAATRIGCGAGLAPLDSGPPAARHDADERPQTISIRWAVIQMSI